MINNETHTRFWVSLPRAYFNELSSDAKELNLSVTAYAGQVLSQYIEKKHAGINQNYDDSSNVRSPEELNKDILVAIDNIQNGVHFTVKDLFIEEKWDAMSRSEKAISAKILAAYQRNSDSLVVVEKKNKAAVYENKGGD